MELSLELRQRQVLSLRQRQSVEILQMDALALAEYAKELAEENPLLEWQEEAPREQFLQKLEWLEESDEQNRGLYRMEHEAGEPPEAGEAPAQTLREYLFSQIHMLKLAEAEKKMLGFLAENTAESGYLEADALPALMERCRIGEAAAERILRQFQTLEPIGVGARDLRECLLLQLHRKNASPLACEIAAAHLELLAKNRLGQLAKKLRVSIAAVQRAAAEIRACEPKPGRGFAGGRVEYIRPDVLVEGLRVQLCGNAVPRLQISHAYVKMLRQGADAETQAYIAEKLKQAEWALQCISRRENTLLQTAEAIVRRQTAFFGEGGQLAPLRMADIAEEMGVHPSTVSRAVKGKYLQCERGLFPLQAFFSQELAGEGISADQISQSLRCLIEQEDRRHPLSDRELTERLQADGIEISRRTVAKYREGMGIPAAAGRRIF